MTRNKEKWSSKRNRRSGKERRGRPPETLAEYDEAVAIYTYHVEEKGRADLAVDLAMYLTNRSGALRDLGRDREAVADLHKAVGIFARLVEGEGRADLRGHLALTLSNRGGLLKELERLPEAVADYDKAIAIYTRLVEEEGRVELTRHLAIILSDRGCIRKALGKLPEAVADFDRAIAICTRLEEWGVANAADVLAMNLTNRGYVLCGLGKFREAFADHDRAVVILTRLVREEGRLKLERELAISLGNRGNALGDLDEMTMSFEDYDRAAAIMKRLIEEEGQTDLVDVLAMLRRSRVEMLEWQGEGRPGLFCFKERSFALTGTSCNPAAVCGKLSGVMSSKRMLRRRALKQGTHISVKSGAVYVVPFSHIRSYLAHEILSEALYRSDCDPIVLFPQVEAGTASKEWFDSLLDNMDELHWRHPREKLETPGISPVGGGVDIGLIDIPVTFGGPLSLVASNLKHHPTKFMEENLRHVDSLFAGTFHDQMTLVSVLHVFKPGGERQIHYHNLVFGVRREFRDGRELIGPLDLRRMLDALTSELRLGVVGLG